MALQLYSPTTPLILGVGSLSGGEAANGQFVVYGFADPGTTITVYYGIRVLGTATVAETGAWSLTPAASIKNGVYKFTAISIDDQSNWSSAAQVLNTTVGSSAPPLPAPPQTDALVEHTGLYSTAITHGSATIDPHPTMSGTGTPGDTIAMYEGTSVIGSTVVGADGAWSLAPALALKSGPHKICVVETNSVGFSSAPSGYVEFTVLDISPPLITYLETFSAEGAIVNQHVSPDDTVAQTNVVIHGQGERGSTITVYDGTSLLGSFVLDTTGNWSFEARALASLTHDLSATQTAVSGAISPASNHFVFTIDTSTPAAPAILSVQRGLGSDASIIPAGQTTDDSRPSVSGIGQAGNIVTLYDGSTVIGSTLVASDGTWHLQPEVALGNGIHHFSVDQTNKAGTVGPHSGSFDFTTLTAPTIFCVAEFDLNHVNSSVLSPEQVTASRNLQIEGFSEPNAVIKLYEGSQYLGSTVAKLNGSWAFFLNSWTVGTHDVSARQLNASGTESSSSDHINFTVDTTLRMPPVITCVREYDTHNRVVEVSAIVPNASVVGYAKIHLVGRGEPGAVIKIYDGADLVCSTKVKATGTWESNVPFLDDGSYDFSATQTYTTGIVSAVSNHFLVTIDTTLASAKPVAPVILNVQDNVGMSRGSITSDSTTDDSRPVVNGTGKAGNLITLFDGVTAIGSAVVDADDTWSLQPTVALANGSHLLCATDMAAGFIVSEPSQQFGFTVATSVIGGRTRAIASSDATATDEHQNSVAVAAEADPATPVSSVHAATVSEQASFTGVSGHETVDLSADPAHFAAANGQIHGNSGSINVLHLLGDDQILDLTSLTGKTSAAKLSGVEVFDLGGHSNTLKLSLVDVLNLGEMDLFQTDGKQQLLVSGHAGDAVDLSNSHVAGLSDGQWEQHTTAEVGGVVYNVFEHSGAHTELLVQQGMQVALHN
jgi:hypothetical protein